MVEAHLKDLDDAGLLDATVEQSLPPELLERLARMRQRES